MKKTKAAILLSGGKDSVYAFHKAIKKFEVNTAIIMLPKNPSSWMFHAINAKYAVYVAKALGIKNIITKVTSGEKEKELDDLENVLARAKQKHGIKTIITGAIASSYQKTRFEKVAKKLKLGLYAPMWKKDQYAYMKEVIKKVKFIIVGIFCEGIDKDYLGKVIEEKELARLYEASRKYGFNISFEGGEAETLAIDADFFKKRLKVYGKPKKLNDFEWVYEIKKVILEAKD